MTATERVEYRVPGLNEPISHYTDAVRFGNLLFISGIGPVDGDFYLVGGDAAGEASAECVEDAANPNLGKWSAHPPTCKVRDCGTLPPPEVVGGRKEDAPASKTILVGGGVGEGETVYKASAEFACHEGYDLNDSSRKSTCLASGKWSGKAGKCAIKVR